MLRSLKHLPLNSLYLYGGSLLASAMNYLYNIIMAREGFLGPAEFGSLAALTSLLYLGNIAASTLTTTAANYVATLVGRQQQEHIGRFIRYFGWYVALFGLAGAGLIVAISPFLARQLHFSSPLPVFLLAPIFLLSLLVAITLGTLQGLSWFGMMAIVFVAGAGLRLLLAIPLVGILLYGINGALLAALLASLVMYALSLIPLRQYLLFKQETSPIPSTVITWPELAGYTHQVFWVVLGLTSLLSIDVILAQHYLPTTDASLYGALSTLGRIIYFAALPIIMIMFPLATKKFAGHESSNKIVFITGIAICVVVVPLLIAYALMPQFIIRLSVGRVYQEGSSDLWIFGLFFTALTLATWLVYALLAQRKNIGWMPPAAVALQAILIIFWHDSPRQIIVASLVATLFLVVLTVIRWQHK